MKKKTIYQVDAFTTEPFKGNPAGVMILEEEISTELMQQIASEMNLAESAFVNINTSNPVIRYFTPTTEVPICGHATVASAHILYELGIKEKTDTIVFKAKAGDFTITNSTDGIEITFPKYQFQPTNINAKFKDCLGFTPIEMYSSENNWTVAIANTENEIINAVANYSKMSENGLGQLIISAKTYRNDLDYVVRCFAPDMGIDEDPVTGSAQCALAPIWEHKLKKDRFKVEQVSKRTGLMDIKLTKDVIKITGKAVTLFKAELNL